MKDFQQIDWRIYNRPPYYQQWLCREDTFRLATFGDEGLADLDAQLLTLKDQWDLENGKEHALDRIGKLLNEHRNGNTDAYYRILLKLRRLLNTNDGSIPSIIKAIKFFYSSEVVHIVPDYPAGLIIEHDGEGTIGLNFNKLLTEIIPAGVSFSTKELFAFIEELFSRDEQLIQVHCDPKEEFEGRIYHNRRVLHDGHTIGTTELKISLHDGVNYHNSIAQYNSRYETGATSVLKRPLSRESGYRDPLVMRHILPMRDFQFSQLFHNGSIQYRVRAKHNGEFMHKSMTTRMPPARHNGRSLYSMSDAIAPFALQQPTIENLPSGEDAAVNLTVYDSDQVRKPHYHDGRNNHNALLFHSGWTLDLLSLFLMPSFTDMASGALYHQGILRHDGSENHSGAGKTFAYEKHRFKIDVSAKEEISPAEEQVLNFENKTSELVSRYFHDRKYKHNATMSYDGPIYDTMATRVELSPIRDRAAGILRHNKSIVHNGMENHSFTGTQAVYEASLVELENKSADEEAVGETLTLAFDHTQDDAVTHAYRYNRSIRHAGTTYHSSILNDTNRMACTLVPTVDIQLGRLLHNGSIKRNGDERHQNSRIAYDTFTSGVRYHRFHNGDYFRNNGIKHNTAVLIPLEDSA